MNNKQILEMSKNELEETIEQLPKGIQPQWLKTANKDELSGYLLCAIKIPEVARFLKTKYIVYVLDKNGDEEIAVIQQTKEDAIQYVKNNKASGKQYIVEYRIIKVV